MRKKAFSLAAGVLVLSVAAVSAATVTDNLNLRSGPGIRHCVAAGHGAAWAITARQGMPTEHLFPLVGRPMLLRRPPELSHRLTAMVTPRPGVLLGLQTRGLVTAVGVAGDIAVTPLTVDADNQSPAKTQRE